MATPPALVLISCGNKVSSTNTVELFAPSNLKSNTVLLKLVTVDVGAEKDVV